MAVCERQGLVRVTLLPFDCVHHHRSEGAEGEAGRVAVLDAAAAMSQAAAKMKAVSRISLFGARTPADAKIELTVVIFAIFTHMYPWSPACMSCQITLQHSLAT